MVETKIVLCLRRSHDIRSVLGPKWVLILSCGVQVRRSMQCMMHDICMLRVDSVVSPNPKCCQIKLHYTKTSHTHSYLASAGLSLPRENDQVASIATFLLLVSSTWYVAVVVGCEKVPTFLKKQSKPLSHPNPIQHFELDILKLY